MHQLAQRYSSGIVTSVFIIGAGIFWAPIFVKAADTKNACITSQSKLKELVVLEGNKDDASPEQIKAELGLRKEILNQTVLCATNEATNLKNGLSTLTITDGDISHLRSEYSDDLDRLIRYYDNQRVQINNLALYGSKQFAKSLKEWRLGSYNPPAQHAAHLIIWVKNQELLNAASAREKRIEDIVNALKVSDNEDIKNALSTTKDALSHALAANDDARKLLGPTSDPNDLLQSIKESLSALAEAYKGFATLADLIAKTTK
jgi:hypothetical protein